MASSQPTACAVSSQRCSAYRSGALALGGRDFGPRTTGSCAMAPHHPPTTTPACPRCPPQEWNAKATDRKDGATKVYEAAQKVLRVIHRLD